MSIPFILVWNLREKLNNKDIIVYNFKWNFYFFHRARKPQPDNREFNESRNGEDEACIAVLNDFYKVRNNCEK